jgi:UDP-N-acetylglucosamine 4,6-dehydratase
MKINNLKNKKILITGGLGTVGQALTKELLQHDPNVIRIYDINEEKQSQIYSLYENYDNVRFLLGDIRDKERLKYAIEDIDIVFHCAALKHVYACEYNPFEAIKTNVIGTQNLIDVSLEEKIDKLIFTSSDKAVNPTNMMGISKLVAEKLIISANFYRGWKKTIFSIVRFGNILGSSGSVLNIFKTQILEGGPVTITDSNMTRFIMTQKEAINLLLNALLHSERGEIFIPFMKSIKITDLAVAMIQELAPGNIELAPYGNIKRKIIGTKIGEKIYEELIREDELGRLQKRNNTYIVSSLFTELPPVERNVYNINKESKIKSYRSDDTRLLSIDEIVNILRSENLI